MNLTISAPGGSYEIVVGDGVLGELPARLEALGLRGTLWLISDETVFGHYGAALEATLRDAGRVVRSHTVAPGEASKDIDVVMDCYTWMLGNGVERRDTVLALGGGVIGDMAGFVAATVLRGVAVVQIPTNLQSMVDSALGGKTGINHPHGKNLIGAFHQPRLVLSDTATLATVPPRELRAGWAEAIKHGVIRDAGLFDQIEAAFAAAPDQLVPTPELLRRAVKVKVDVVNADERETGERMLLNYGHTLGHAVEAAAGYGTLLHGEAIAIGMELEARIAEQLGTIDEATVARQRALLQRAGLPIHIPAELGADDILGRTLRDKKVQAGKVRWALPTSIGSSVVRDDVPADLVRNVVESGYRA